MTSDMSPQNDKSIGKVYGVGLGPGAIDLLSVRADKLVREAKHIAFFRKAGRSGQARTIIEGLLREDVVEFPMEYPVTTEIPLTDPRYNEILSQFYEDCVAHIRTLLMSGEDVIILCEGDPFFYGSFMHLYTRVKDEVEVEVVPAITGMSGAWTATGLPITWGDDILTVLMATLSETIICERLSQTDAAIIMKIGQNLPKICSALKQAGRFDDAYIVEYASMPAQKICLLKDYPSQKAPYFSIIVLHGHGRRP